MDKYILIFVTVGSKEEGVSIGRKLIEEKLAACANIVPQVNSIFNWKGEVCEEKELLMIIKSKESMFNKIRDRVIKLHSYDVPEIIAIPIILGSPDYLEWMDEVMG